MKKAIRLHSKRGNTGIWPKITTLFAPEYVDRSVLSTRYCGLVICTCEVESCTTSEGGDKKYENVRVCMESVDHRHTCTIQRRFNWGQEGLDSYELTIHLLGAAIQFEESVTYEKIIDTKMITVLHYTDLVYWDGIQALQGVSQISWISVPYLWDLSATLSIIALAPSATVDSGSKQLTRRLPPIYRKTEVASWRCRTSEHRRPERRTPQVFDFLPSSIMMNISVVANRQSEAANLFCTIVGCWD